VRSEGEAWWTRAPAESAAAPATSAAPAPAAPAPAKATTRPRGPAPAPRPPLQLPPAPFGDQRGLTAAGAALLVLVLASIGAGVDLARGDSLGIVFTLSLCVSAGLAASTVHTEDLFASVVLVPLVFAPIALVGTALDSTLPNSALINVAETFIEQAPTLIFAVLSAAVVAGARAIIGRSRGPRRIVTYR
jgi:uncharacterized protein DUF6542